MSIQANIVGGSYQNKYISVNSERTINWYIHKQLLATENDKTPGSLQPTPGLSVFSDTTRNYGRKLFVARTLNYTRCFAVVDNYLYELGASPGDVTNRGQMTALTNDTSFVYLSCNSEDQVIIGHPSCVYIFNLATNTLTQIVAGNYIFNLAVTSGGSVYASPTLTIFDSYGAGALASVSQSGGVLGTPSLVAGGTGYVTPVVTILDPSGTGGSITCTVSGGVITGLTKVSGGTGYVNPKLVIHDSSAPGTGATGTLTGNVGVITGATINTRGNLYNSPVVGITDTTGSGGVITATTQFNAVPVGLNYVDYTEGYFIGTYGGRVVYSNLLDGTTWNGANVFTPDADADSTLAVVVWRDFLHCFGAESIEIYIDDGTDPFIKQYASTINIGLVSVDSLAVFDSGIIFLGKAKSGERNVYFYNGQTCAPIAPSDVTWQINKNSLYIPSNNIFWNLLNVQTWDKWNSPYPFTIGSPYGMAQYTKDGHVLYYLTIPGQTTYVFDVTGREWTERQSRKPNSSTDSVFRGTSIVNWNGYNLFTDLYTGKIFVEDYFTPSEDGLPITRTRQSSIISQNKQNISIYSFELDSSTGIGLSASPSTTANITLSYSRDGGNTFVNPINLNMGANGTYLARPRVFKLGTARDWVFLLVMTDAADVAINSGIIHGQVESY